MRFSLSHCLVASSLILACGGRTSATGKRSGNDGNDSSGGSWGTGGDGAANVGGTIGGRSSGGVSSGGVSSGGVSSGGVSSGGVSSGGSAAGGPSFGGESQGGAAGGLSGGGTDGSGGVSVDEHLVGHVEQSCGAYMWSYDEETLLQCRPGAEHEGHPDCVIVDCTRHGDTDAICVFSNHCMCSDGFECEEGPTSANGECGEPRLSCVPAR